MNKELEAASDRGVSRETIRKLAQYEHLLRAEVGRQNLVSAQTLENLWQRHIVDSAQLVRFETYEGASWVDIGSGGGLPGVIIACLVQGPVTLIEPRRLRAQFLKAVVDELDLSVTVIQRRAESISGSFDMITGRAVASLSSFLDFSSHLSTKNTRFVLPKGRRAESELAEARQSWQGVFHLERSRTDAGSYIVIADKLRSKR